ncbi:hypothetical protein ACFLSJ_05885, partial [Verrucomicrobiota bacterium]
MISPIGKSAADCVIPARLHPSGFRMSDANFYSLTRASDNNIYYTLCSHNIDTHGRVYRYNPGADEVTLVGDLGEITGEAGQKTLPQGKSHTPFFEYSGKLFFATQYGFFRVTDEKEELAPLPEGYKPYPGGHFISIDLASPSCDVLATAPKEEGILTMGMDTVRGRMYGLTWPGGLFLAYDLGSGVLRNRGPVSRGGEMGTGDRYFCLCRTFAVFPEDGSVYFTNADGEILRYDWEADLLESVKWAHLRRDILGHWDPHEPGHQGYNWRPCKWHPERRVFFGVHPKSGYLFCFDPRNRKLEYLSRPAAPQRRLRALPVRVSDARVRPGRSRYRVLPFGHVRHRRRRRPAGRE